jgi:hypothetical protein
MSMRLLDGELRLSASVLMRFKGCRDATTLEPHRGRRHRARRR